MENENKQDEIVVILDDGSELTLYTIDQTVLRGDTYLLAADTKDGDGTACILKEVSGLEDAESVYEIVEDDTEIAAVSPLFRDALEDMDILLEEE